MRIRLVLLAWLALGATVGCGGPGGCPALSLDMRSLAAQATSIEFDVYDASASCAGNDVAAGSPGPLVSRRVDGHGGTQLSLPAGHYVVVLHAFDATGAFIGSACQAELFTPGQEACLTLDLTQPMYDGDGGVIAPVSDGGGGTGGSGGGTGGPDMASGFVTQTSPVVSDLYQPWTPGGGIVYIAGAAGVVLKTTDYGATWNKLNTGTTNDIESVWGTSATDLYAVGATATVLHTTDGGMTWTKVTTGAASMPWFYQVWGTAANDVYVVGDFGTVVHFNGSSWSKTNIGGGNGPFIESIWGASPTEVYLFNGAGAIYKGSGLSFSQVSKPTSDRLTFGWGAAATGDIWIPSQSMSLAGTLWHSSDHGATFQSQLTVPGTIWSAWSTPSGHGYALGAALLKETTDHGATWTDVMSTQATLYSMAGDAAGNLWIAGINGVILHKAP